MPQKPRPLIAVPTDLKPFENYIWHAAPEQYLSAAIDVAGVTPLLVPSFGSKMDIETILAGVNGLLVTGSKSNVNPELYGVEPNENFEPYDNARDATSLPLIRAAIEKGVPVLAICRGLQELNVALGGTLATEIQELEGRIDHRAPETASQEERFALQHSVKIAPDSCLAGILKSESVKVNSVHRQAIDKLAPQLEIEAVADDGTIEAVSVKNAAGKNTKGFVVGVQWHPEYWAQSDMPSRKIFEAFGEAVRIYHAERTV
ncbi:gamma-glutamyl-gamma-aminobutyrate hydrolase family protein [Brucella gallinifaecis]|uniref:gamma-glutamyl-gamma-aminobutyrate hydrolase n=1 Tax=Brucella gallinifaecis TaxID=215590 RepID=A0A502BQD1_9HYPH|nr:gamma-glutamyl-gamma-aminobutyrate hydrolase family protein [Brucella gallinifaecis]TPF76425.1 gamma-glutamyl-gamma-aminobutyrate hydrolase family protein [Brucella gallinifaecis]